MSTIASRSVEDQRIAGAKECIAALVTLVQSANNLPEAANDSAVFASIQAGDAEALVSVFGPLTPRQEGAFRTLAEYIHCCETTGLPELGRWTPFVADTQEEIAAWIEETNRDE